MANQELGKVGNQVWNSKNLKVGMVFDGMEIIEIDRNTGISLFDHGTHFYTWKNFNIYFGSQFVK